MSPLQDRIAQLRKMANDDPDNELGHYSLGEKLLEAGQFDEAIQSLRRALELSPQFPRCFYLLAQAFLGQNNRDEAIRLLREGYTLAVQLGNNLPRDDMAKMLTQLGEPVPVASKTPAETGSGDGFHCQRPGCVAGPRAQQLPSRPLGLDKTLGERIRATVCAGCWNDWLRNMSIKVINELHLDLSTERGAEEYDRYMREYLGLD